MILVHSPKGGVGSTTVAANLALLFAERRIETTAIDLTGQGLLTVPLGGQPSRVSDDGMDATGGTIVLGGVRVLSLTSDRSPGQTLGLIGQHCFAGGTTIVDLASTDRRMLDLLLPLATLRICVLAPEPGSLATLPQAIGPIASEDPTLFVINRADDRLRLARDIGAVMRDLLGDLLIGTVRRDEAVNEAAAMMEPIGRYAPASAALADFRALAQRIVDRVDIVHPVEAERGAA